MATKEYYSTGDFRYGTRMLKAGDPVELTAPKARLYQALGRVTPEKPRPVRAMTTELPAAEKPIAATTAAPKRKAARKRKTAAKK